MEVKEEMKFEKILEEMYNLPQANQFPTELEIEPEEFIERERWIEDE